MIDRESSEFRAAERLAESVVARYCGRMAPHGFTKAVATEIFSAFISGFEKAVAVSQSFADSAERQHRFNVAARSWRDEEEKLRRSI